MVQLEERKGRFLVEGTEVLSFRLHFPRGEDGTRMGEFYREIGERVETFCEKHLRPWAEREFERCEDPKKRFYFPSFFYCLETRTHEDGGSLGISMRATLGRRRSAESICQWEQELIWSAKEDCLLPPKPSKKEKKEKTSVGKRDKQD